MMQRGWVAYAPQLGAQLHITHTQLNIIGSPYYLVQYYSLLTPLVTQVWQEIVCRRPHIRMVTHTLYP